MKLTTNKKISNVIYQLELLSLYKALLTSRQIKYFKLYFEQNLTYAEIAKMFKITRAAVGETISKTKEQLKFFETKLHLLELSQKRMVLLQKIQDDKLRNALIKLEDKSRC